MSDGILGINGARADGKAWGEKMAGGVEQEGPWMPTQYFLALLD